MKSTVPWSDAFYMYSSQGLDLIEVCKHFACH